jgi:hypothetical protein
MHNALGLPAAGGEFLERGPAEGDPATWGCNG